MNHPTFAQRPQYYQALNLSQLRALSTEHSRAGHYNLTTLWWYRKLWLTTGKGYDYLAYLCFRRALGYPLTAAKANKLRSFLQHWPVRYWHKLIGHRLRQSKNLLTEYLYLQGHKIGPAAVPRRYRQQVTYWRSQQQQWHIQLIQQLQQAGSVHVVGNSPKLAGTNSGKSIDSADIVVRFNQYQSTQTLNCDSGSKCDIWVMAPAFGGTIPVQPDWCLISGADMVWWQQRWPQFTSRPQGNESLFKLLSIPLPHWRALVRQLAAPPSAGLLLTHYIASIVIKPGSLKLFGFGYNPAAGQYHYATPGHQAVSRHNWPAEYQLLQCWQQSTLQQSTEQDEI